jgi:hypothetical protein
MQNMNNSLTALSTAQMAKEAQRAAGAQRARDDVLAQLLASQVETNDVLRQGFTAEGTHLSQIVAELQAQNRMLWDLLQRGLHAGTTAP